MKMRFPALPLVMLTTALACGGAEATESPNAAAAVDPGTVLVVQETLAPDNVVAPATVEPFNQATVSTKLMGRVVSVSRREGDVVAAGAVLLELDARDLVARKEQAQAALESATAVRTEGALQAGRMRALFADSAAPRAQLDAAEAGLVRAEQGVRAARAALAEVESLADYAVVRAPFAGVVAQRFVDPGAFAAPGSPLMQVEDASRLRVIAAVPSPAAMRVRRGTTVLVTIEGVDTEATVEGIVPVVGAALVSVRAVADNRQLRFSSGSAATMSLPGPERPVLLVPSQAIVRSGGLTGVRMPSGGAPVTRWVRLGRTRGDAVEVLSGLSSGDSILVPSAPAGN